MRRLRGACALEVKVARRYGITTLATVLALLWTGLLVALPSSAAPVVAPYLLFLDTAGFGALFTVALLMFERVEGTDTARAVTPLRSTEATGARVGVLTVVSVAIALPMSVVTVPAERVWSAVGYTTAGVTLTSVLLLATCMGLGARARTLQGALLSTAPALVLFITAPLPHLAGVVHGPLLWVVPTTAGAELINRGVTGQVGTPEGPGGWVVLLYTVGCAVMACWWSIRRTGAPIEVASPFSVSTRSGVEDASATGPVTAPRSGRPRARSTTGSGHPLLALARYELTTVLRDPLLLVVALAPVPVSLLLRWAYPAIGEFVRSTYGFDLAPHAPAVFGALVLLHVPSMVGSVVALRVVEDIDDRTLLVLRVSPLSLTSYFVFRAGTAAFLALLGLVVAAPLSGLAPAVSTGLITAVVLAALSAPLVVMVTAAFASNKVEALVVLKSVGAVFALLPVLVWALPAFWWTPLLALPPTWSLLALPGYPVDGLPSVLVLLGGSVSTIVVAVGLARRARSRLPF